MEELWADIPGFEGEYQASTLGNVRSIKRGLCRMLNQVVSTGGYKVVCLSLHGKTKNLGHEYHDNDGGGMDDHVIDAPGLPAPGDTTPTEEELEKAYDDGYQAAAEGKPESDCPVMRGELCIQWVKGWKDFMNGVEKAA